MKEMLTIIRNILYRIFIIGFIFSIVSQLALIFMDFEGINEAAKLLHVSSTNLIMVILNSINFVKVFLFYGILCPALAIHWTISRDKLLKNK